MQVSKRLFPYPVINQAKEITCYKNSTFSFSYDEIEKNEKDYIIKNIHYILENKNISNLIQEEKAKVELLIECSDTLYRKRFDIYPEPIDIVIPKTHLNGKIEISCYIYSLCEIQNYSDDDFIDEYLGYSFNIEKNDFLAIDDGYKFRIDYPESDDNKVSSIFKVIPDLESDDESMIIRLSVKKIEIHMSDIYFGLYDNINGNPNYEYIFFSVFAVPALAFAIEQVKDKEVDVVAVEYSWFNSITKAYKNIYKEEFTEEVYSKYSSIELAQALMNYPVMKALDSLYEMAWGQKVGDDDE